MYIRLEAQHFSEFVKVPQLKWDIWHFNTWIYFDSYTIIMPLRYVQEFACSGWWEVSFPPQVEFLTYIICNVTLDTWQQSPRISLVKMCKENKRQTSTYSAICCSNITWHGSFVKKKKKSSHCFCFFNPVWLSLYLYVYLQKDFSFYCIVAQKWTTSEKLVLLLKAHQKSV